jgi:hypothetical protein
MFDAAESERLERSSVTVKIDAIPRLPKATSEKEAMDAYTRGLEAFQRGSPAAYAAWCVARDWEAARAAGRAHGGAALERRICIDADECARRGGALLQAALEARLPARLPAHTRRSSTTSAPHISASDR